MEYHVGISRRRLFVEWSGSEVMNRHNIRRYSSRLLKVSVQLFLPDMPMNHRVTLCRRLRRVWDRLFPSTAVMNRQLMSAVSALSMPVGVTVSDDLLVPFLEQIGMDDVCTDLDLLGLYYRPSPVVSRVHRLCLVFGFSPDNIAHFLDSRRISHGSICYGPNGDESL